MYERKWQVFGYGSMMLLGILLLVGFVSYEGPATGSSATPTPLPTVSGLPRMACRVT